MATGKEELKQQVAEACLVHVEPGMMLGLGSGSTAELMVHALGRKVQDGLQLKGAVVTSPATGAIAEQYGITLHTLAQVDRIDLTIDGADEVDPDLQLIKGGGGQHLHEKIVAAASEQLLIIVEDSKLVDRLGAFTVPVEVIEAALPLIEREVAELGGRSKLRMKGDAPFTTTERNRILDCDFGLIDEPAALARALADLPGVVEHGLFIDLADRAMVARPDGVETLERA